MKLAIDLTQIQRYTDRIMEPFLIALGDLAVNANCIRRVETKRDDDGTVYDLLVFTPDGVLRFTHEEATRYYEGLRPYLIGCGDAPEAAGTISSIYTTP